MIDIGVKRNEGLIQACYISGHAEYDEHGYDIVCAAISALSCTAILGLTEVVHDGGHYENAPAHCTMEPANWTDPRAQAILDTMVLGFQEISRQYGDFVRITTI